MLSVETYNDVAKRPPSDYGLISSKRLKLRPIQTFVKGHGDHNHVLDNINDAIYGGHKKICS